MSGFRLTHIGGPTVLIEIDGWRLLTDPTFDPPGEKYDFGWGARSEKLSGPVIGPDEIGEVDAVLLSHEHHDDNLDPTGRELLPKAGRVLTTVSGAQALEGTAVAEGLDPWHQTILETEGKPTITVTATPCRLYKGVMEVAERVKVDTAVVHLGGVRFPVTGPLKYTMNAADAVKLSDRIAPRYVVPIHYEGWKHFREGKAAVEAEFATAPAGFRERVRWLEPGESQDFS